MHKLKYFPILAHKLKYFPVMVEQDWNDCLAQRCTVRKYPHCGAARQARATRSDAKRQRLDDHIAQSKFPVAEPPVRHLSALRLYPRWIFVLFVAVRFFWITYFVFSLFFFDIVLLLGIANEERISLASLVVGCKQLR